MSWYFHLFCKEIFSFFLSQSIQAHACKMYFYSIFFFPIWEKCENVYCYENIHPDNITYTSNCIHLAATSNYPGITDVYDSFIKVAAL